MPVYEHKLELIYHLQELNIKRIISIKIALLMWNTYLVMILMFTCSIISTLETVTAQV